MTFYEPRQQQAKPRPACPITARLKATFESTERCYGSRRLLGALRSEGMVIGRFKVRGLMKQ